MALIAAILLIVEVRRSTPEEKERKRRLAVNRIGRLSDCVIVDVDDSVALHYTYRMHGVLYSTSQEVSTLLKLLPARPEKLVGPAYVKYVPRLPSNSIVVCEEWSGLRVPPGGREFFTVDEPAALEEHEG